MVPPKKSTVLLLWNTRKNINQTVKSGYLQDMELGEVSRFIIYYFIYFYIVWIFVDMQCFSNLKKSSKKNKITLHFHILFFFFFFHILFFLKQEFLVFHSCLGKSTHPSPFFRTNSTSCAFNITTFLNYFFPSTFPIPIHSSFNIILQICFNFLYILYKPSHLPPPPMLLSHFYFSCMINFIHSEWLFPLPSINF